MSDEFREHVSALGFGDRIDLTSSWQTYNEGDAEPLIDMMLDVGDEALSVQLDAYHLRKLRLAVQHAEKWVEANLPAKQTGGDSA